MSEYHKIETLYERDEKTHRLKPELILKNRIYGAIKSWVWTEKIDGTNIRAIWKSEKLIFGGKTDNAQMHAELIRWLSENITVDKITLHISGRTRRDSIRGRLWRRNTERGRSVFSHQEINPV
jgi:hypothetical protein